MQTLTPDEREAPAEQPAQANWPWVPWALAAAFAVLAFVLLGMSGSLRQRTAELNQQLAEAQQAYADLQSEQTNLQRKLVKVETNYTARIADLQKQVVQKNQETQRQKFDLESRGNDIAQVQKQLTVLRTQNALSLAELDRLNESLTGVNAPQQNQLLQLRLGVLNPTPEGPPNAAGSAAWDLAAQRGLLVVEGLPPLGPDRDYQLWIVDANMIAPISGGVFRTNERGNTRSEFRATGPVRSADRFAVSIERKGGTTLPQGRFVLASN